MKQLSFLFCIEFLSLFGNFCVCIKSQLSRGSLPVYYIVADICRLIFHKTSRCLKLYLQHHTLGSMTTWLWPAVTA